MSSANRTRQKAKNKMKLPSKPPLQFKQYRQEFKCFPCGDFLRYQRMSISFWKGLVLRWNDWMWVSPWADEHARTKPHYPLWLYCQPTMNIFTTLSLRKHFIYTVNWRKYSQQFYGTVKRVIFKLITILKAWVTEKFMQIIKPKYFW